MKIRSIYQIVFLSAVLAILFGDFHYLKQKFFKIKKKLGDFYKQKK